MNRKGLTLTVITLGRNLNYGEGFGNISSLKTVNRENETYSLISNTKIKYCIKEQLKWNQAPIANLEESKVAVYSLDGTIVESPELDLFGYFRPFKSNLLKGKIANSRKSPVRVSGAMSLEPYAGDMIFQTNVGMSRPSELTPMISNSEIHYSYYTYTICIDLDEIGVDKCEGLLESEIKERNFKTKEELKEARIERVGLLLDVIKNLYCDGRGCREDFSPVLVIGGLVNQANPYFINAFKFNKYHNSLPLIDIDRLDSCLEKIDEKDKEQIRIGLAKGFFSNEEELLTSLGKDNVLKIGKYFSKLKDEVKDYYEDCYKTNR